MADLITRLEQDHRAIIEHLDAIRAAGFSREVAIRQLRLAKGLIVGHLAEEDRSLYQPMLTHPTAAATARLFQERMQPITAEVLAFFARYDVERGFEPDAAFSQDLGALTQKLRSRVRQEEERLYPLYRQTLATGASPIRQ